MQVTINVCPKCGYWPINGESDDVKCKQCGNRHASDGSLLDTYMQASGYVQMPTVKMVIH